MASGTSGENANHDKNATQKLSQDLFYHQSNEHAYVTFKNVTKQVEKRRTDGSCEHIDCVDIVSGGSRILSSVG